MTLMWTRQKSAKFEAPGKSAGGTAIANSSVAPDQPPLRTTGLDERGRLAGKEVPLDGGLRWRHSCEAMALAWREVKNGH